MRKSIEYQTLAREGDVISSNFVRIKVLTSAESKLGITVSKKFGKAHLRNRFKRRVREAYRLSLSEMCKGITIHISPRKRHLPTLNELRGVFLSFQDFGSGKEKHAALKKNP